MQRDQLVRLGCTYAQGYHFARPMPAADIEALLDLQTLSWSRADLVAQRIDVRPG
jgi:EAL domain-containing protein (putative c-di-GMP-specific phosphodiesterase class I)